jgi:hypothetical protein
MGLKISIATIVGIDDHPFIPADFVGEEELSRFKKYMEDHPFPDDELYSEGNFLEDMRAEEIYRIPDGVKKATVDYIQTILTKIIS